jgi:hypothetical protein
MGFLSCDWREPPSCAKRQHGIPSPSKSNSFPLWDDPNHRSPGSSSCDYEMGLYKVTISRVSWCHTRGISHFEWSIYRKFEWHVATTVGQLSMIFPVPNLQKLRSSTKRRYISHWNPFYHIVSIPSPDLPFIRVCTYIHDVSPMFTPYV